MNDTKNIFGWFNKPYYFNNTLLFKLATTFGVSSFIGLYLYIFRPFGIDKMSSNVVAFCVGVTFSIIVVLLIYFFIITRLYPKFFNNDNWTVGRQMTTVLSLMLLSGIAVWVFNQFIYYDEVSRQIPVLKYVSFIFITGLLPVVIYLFLDEKYGSYRRKLVSDEIMTKKKKNIITSDSIINKILPRKKMEFVSQNSKDKIFLNINNLVYVSSQGNYVSFFLKDTDNLIKERILRTRLQIVEKKFEKFPQIIRCHKSYIINSNFVKSISGNARGYYLHFSDLDLEIPVSRNFDINKLSTLVNSLN